MTERLSVVSVDREETVNTRSYRWTTEQYRVALTMTQPFGTNEIIGALKVEANAADFRTEDDIFSISWGRRGDEPGNRAHFVNAIELGKLQPRGMVYTMVLYRKGEQITPPLEFTTLLRYPYGRGFEDYRQRSLRKPDESRVVLYWEEDVDSTELRRMLAETSPADYLDHIVRSITHQVMPEMERAKAVLDFLGRAMQHSAVYLNKVDSVPAMERFLTEGCQAADTDLETVLNLELGYTRCGFINGFMQASLCKRIGLTNEVFFSNGGHTSGKVKIDGEWYLADADAFKKGVYPLMKDGSLPPISWLKENDHLYLLDTVPGWEDTNPDEGWILNTDGFRVTGFIGGGRSHSETGYTSTWFGAPRAYPPSVPKPLPIRQRNGTHVLLEWLGSYDRDGDFRDYRIEMGSGQGHADIGVWTTTSTSIAVELPNQDDTYYWRVRARDDHGKGSEFAEAIYYTPSLEQTIAPERDKESHEIPDEQSNVRETGMGTWEFYDAQSESQIHVNVSDLKNLTGVVRFIEESRKDGGLSDFTRLEGFDDVLGQTNLARTELFGVKSGHAGSPVFRLVDPTNYWFNGLMCRSLWVRPFDELPDGDWTFSLTVELAKDGFGGERSFPLAWIGERGSYTGIGLMLDCRTGHLHFSTNLFGDWRKGPGVPTKGKLQQFEVAWSLRDRSLTYVYEGLTIGSEDCTLRDARLIVNGMYISSNPEGELDCCFHRLQLQAAAHNTEKVNP